MPTVKPSPFLRRKQEREDKPSRSTPFDPEKLIIRFVDGESIRNESLDHQEFGSFATHLQFPDLIPEEEIWIDSRVPEEEQRFFIIAAKAELEAHYRQEMSEEEAYEYGLVVQRSERERDPDPEFGGQRPYHDEIPQDIYLEELETFQGGKMEVHVWLVDGTKVRNMYKTDWVEGGHAFVYPYIPEDEIWIEDQVRESERKFVILHESTERDLMRNEEMDYDEAHEYASKVEFEARQKQGEEHATKLEADYHIAEQKSTGNIYGMPDDHLRPRKQEDPRTGQKALDKQDGEVPLDLEKAKEFDFITLPKDVDGTNCSNCLFVKEKGEGHICNNPNLQGFPVNERNCCALWDADGTIRGWKQKTGQKAMSAMSDTSGGALVAPPAFMGKKPRRRRPSEIRIKSSYFETCPRDETGHCRPKGTANLAGQGGGKDPHARQPSKREEEQERRQARGEGEPQGEKPKPKASPKVWVPIDISLLDPAYLQSLQQQAQEQLKRGNLNECATWLLTQLVQAGGQQGQKGLKALEQDLPSEEQVESVEPPPAEEPAQEEVEAKPPKTKPSPFAQEGTRRKPRIPKKVRTAEQAEKPAEAKPVEKKPRQEIPVHPTLGVPVLLPDHAIQKRLREWQAGDEYVQALAKAEDNPRVRESFGKTARAYQAHTKAANARLKLRDETLNRKVREMRKSGKLSKDTIAALEYLEQLAQEEEQLLTAYEQAREQYHDAAYEHIWRAFEKQIRAGESYREIPHQIDEKSLGPVQAERASRAVQWLGRFLNTSGEYGLNGATVRKIADTDKMRGRRCSHYNPRSRECVMRANAESSSHIHELGHYVEYNIPGVWPAAAEFLKHRLATSEPENAEYKKLKDLFPEDGYGDDELGAADNFKFKGVAAYYAAKKYSDGTTEIISMGLEALYSNPTWFAQKDPEYCKFILGILSGSLRRTLKQ